jgi:hypothetical protein
MNGGTSGLATYGRYDGSAKASSLPAAVLKAGHAFDRLAFKHGWLFAHDLSLTADSLVSLRFHESQKPEADVSEAVV